MTTVVVLTSGSSWTVPSDWNNASNKVECVGGGGGGGQAYGTFVGLGGGGGAYSRANNLTLTVGANVNYSVGVGGSQGQPASAGGDTWFSSTGTVLAKGGQPGAVLGDASGTTYGGAGGAAGSGVGSTKFSGGTGGYQDSNPSTVATGGGGAAGPNGNGVDGVGISGANGATAGGAGDAGAGGAGGASGGGTGGAGAEFGSTGSGGGGGGALNATGGLGGAYGGGGGGTVNSGGQQAGNGRQGVIVITYTPLTTANLTATGLAPGSPIIGTPTLNAAAVDAATVLLLHCDGPNGSLTFRDSSGKGHVVTGGSHAFVSALNAKFGSTSACFDATSGAGGHLVLDGSSDFAFGTADFTIDCWVYLTKTTVANIIYDGRNSAGVLPAPTIFVDASGHLTYFTTNASVIVGTTAIPQSAWCHVALVRSSGTTKLYLNGTQEGASYTDSNNYTVGAGGPTIGDYYAGSAPVNGFIDEFRISKTARYPGNFSVPTTQYGPNVLAPQDDPATALLLHFDATSNNWSVIPDATGRHVVTTKGTVAISQTQSEFNTASGFFDGTTGPMLVLDGSSDFAFGTGDYTIEFWFYETLSGFASTNQLIYDGRNPASAGPVPTIWLRTGLLTYSVNGTANVILGATTLAINTWYHVALVRSSGVTKLYLNGVQEGASYADSNSYVASAGSPTIGDIYFANSPFQGYLDELRVSKGIARYTANFTPSALPFVVDAQTVLLLHFDRVLPDSSGRGHHVARVGNMHLDSNQSVFGGSGANFDGTANTSMALDGSSDFFFDGDFTVEMWVKPSALTASAPYGNPFLYDPRPAGTQTGPFLTFFISTLANLGQIQVNTGAGSFVGATALAVNVWAHVAVTRSGSTVRLFVNGVLDGSISDPTSYICGANRPAIGMNGYNPNNSLFQGWMDEIRISKGVGRWTANFVPPPAPYADTNTVLLLHCDGSSGATAFPDTSGKGHVVTANGTAQIGTTQSKFGGAAAFFDGSAGAYLTLDGSTDFAFANSDYTIDFWVRFAALSSGVRYTLYDGRASGTQSPSPTIFADNSTTPGSPVFTYFTNSINAITGTTLIALNTWYHVALVRSGGTTKLYLNGVQEGSSFADTQVVVNGGAGRPIIGGNGANTPSATVNGWIDELRVSTFARWAANFTPPAGPYGSLIPTPLLPTSPEIEVGYPYAVPDANTVLLLHADGASGSTTFVDASANNCTVTPHGNAQVSIAGPKFGSGDASFDGVVGSYLTVTPQTLFNFGTSDFTIDFWLKLNSLPASFGVVTTKLNGGNYGPFFIGILATGVIDLWLSSAGAGWDVANGIAMGVATPGTWAHVALVRQGNSFYTFFNGLRTNAFVSSAALVSNTVPLAIGMASDGTANPPINGHIDEYRVSNVARWTTDFVPLTAPYGVLLAASSFAPSSPVFGTPIIAAAMSALGLAPASPVFGAPALTIRLTALDLVPASPVLGLGFRIGMLAASSLVTASPDLGTPVFTQHQFLGAALDLVTTSPYLGRPDRMPSPPPVYPPTMDRHVRRTGDDYAGALIDLLPRGIAWPRDPLSVLMRAMTGLAQVWGFVDSRAADLLERESDPRETVELLPDWERNWGLPDPCFTPTPTIGERQAMLVFKMTMLGGQSRAFFQSLAVWLGYDITIEEYSPFMAGVSSVGDTRFLYDNHHPRWQIGPPEMRFYWTIHTGQASLTWFRASKGQAGVDPHLRIGTAEDLECLFQRWKPAHTQIVFDYSGLVGGGPMAGTP